MTSCAATPVTNHGPKDAGKQELLVFPLCSDPSASETQHIHPSAFLSSEKVSHVGS